MAGSEKIYTRSDGISETQSGHYAVVMRVQGQLLDNGNSRFEFMPGNFYGDPIAIEWVRDGDFELFPKDVANSLVRGGYATFAVPARAIADHNAQFENEDGRTARKGRKAASEKAAKGDTAARVTEIEKDDENG